MDESGDLGFRNPGRGSSRYFVIAFFCTTNKILFDRIVKKMNTMIVKKYRKRSGVFHATQEGERNIIKLLKSVVRQDEVKIAIAYCKKKNIPKNFVHNKHLFYSMVVSKTLDRLLEKGFYKKDERIIFIASQRETSRFLNQEFKDNIFENIKSKHGTYFLIEIKKPHEEKSLQIVDSIAWAVFQKYEQDDGRFYKIFKHSIVLEYEIFP